MSKMDGLPFSVFAVLLAIGGPAAAKSVAPTPAAVSQPVFKAGDTWVYEDTHERGQTGYSSTRQDVTVERVDGDTMLVGFKLDGAPTSLKDRVFGTDWSRRLVVNGQETVTNRPFAFPMSVGQAWTVDWSDPTRRGELLSGHVHKTCTVEGWQDVAVPAGTLHALKLVCKGVEELQVAIPAHAVAGVVASGGGSTSIAQTQRGGRGTVTHVLYTECYYAPEVRNYVKDIDEVYNTDNVRLSRSTEVLASFKPGT